MTTTTTETPAVERNDNDRPASNFITLRSGRTLAAVQIAALCTTAARRVIKIAPADDGAASSPATIHLPHAREFIPLELVVIDAAGAGFVLVPSGDDQVWGDPGVRGTIASGAGFSQFRYGRPAVRLLPVLSDQFGEPDGWGVL